MTPCASALRRVAMRSIKSMVMIRLLRSLLAAGAPRIDGLGAGRLAQLVLPRRLICAFEGARHLGFEPVRVVELRGHRGRLQLGVHRPRLVFELAKPLQSVVAMA